MRRRFCPDCNQYWQNNNADEADIVEACSASGQDCKELWPVKLGLTGLLNKLIKKAENHEQQKR